MTLSNILAPDIPNFHTLALFVCHLFIDGDFRTGHLVYDQQIIDDRLTIEVNSICKHQIPWTTTDINTPNFSQWISRENSDYILQVIVPNLTKSTQFTGELKKQLRFYRLFIFISTGNLDMNETVLALKNTGLTNDSNSLVLFYNLIKHSIKVHWIMTEEDLAESSRKIFDFNVKINQIQHQQKQSKAENLFHQTFGISELLGGFGIHVIQGNNFSNKLYMKSGDQYFANFIYLEQNATYIDVGILHHKNNRITFDKTYFKYQPASVYKERNGKYRKIES